MPSESALNTRVLEAAARLAAEFKGVFTPQAVELLTQNTFDTFRQARITEFVPLLVYRDTRERLLTIAREGKPVIGNLPEVLFVCVRNAGRSQMAAAFARQLGAGRLEVRSAGTAPGEHVYTPVLEAMREAGLDLSGESPMRLSEEIVQSADVLVTMGCGDACPVLPGRMYLDWDVTDPAGLTIEEVRGIRDDIRERVHALLAELGVVTRASVSQG